MYTSYIRIRHQWSKVGQYHTLCGKFSRITEAENKEQTTTVNQPDDGLSEGIRYLKSLRSLPRNTVEQQVSDGELSELCRSIVT